MSPLLEAVVRLESSDLRISTAPSHQRAPPRLPRLLDFGARLEGHLAYAWRTIDHEILAYRLKCVGVSADAQHLEASLGCLWLLLLD